MRPASRWTFLLASLLLATSLTGCAAHRHPVLDLVSRHQPLDSGLERVSPYFASLYAWELLEDGDDPAPVRDYAAWYLDNLNYPDHHGLTGTMDDMDVLPGGRLRPVGDYDSADGYAAVFLLMLEAYERRTGDRAFLESHRARIQDVAWVLLHLQDPDGLLRAHPGTNARYLMDNCEAYGGLLAYDALARRLGWDHGPRYREAAEVVRRAVLDRLHAGDGAPFHWADAGGLAHESRWDTYYPDALAQLFPILYGVVDARSHTARGLWREFQDRWGSGLARRPDPAQLVIIDLTRKRMES